MTASDLQVGDRIRLLDFSRKNGAGYFIHRDTIRVYRKLLARNRPVVISEVDEFGPWFECRFRKKSGGMEYHFLVVTDEDKWVKVK